MGLDGTSGGDASDTIGLWDTEEEPEDTVGVEPDSDMSDSESMDSEMPQDITTEVDVEDNFEGDLTGSWWVKATPDTLTLCGYDKTFQPQSLALVVNQDGKASGVLEPPGDFITLEFQGNLVGSTLVMVATYTEAGPPSIGSATEHTYTFEVTALSETAFGGTYTHELVPNSGDPCTFVWTVNGAKE
jgi:hypothetical protein